jgi:hypothetical protein
MKLTDTIESVLRHKSGGNRVLFVGIPAKLIRQTDSAKQVSHGPGPATQWSNPRWAT